MTQLSLPSNALDDQRKIIERGDRSRATSRCLDSHSLDALLAHERLLARERDAQAASGEDVLLPLILALARMDAQATARTAGDR